MLATSAHATTHHRFHHVARWTAAARGTHHGQHHRFADLRQHRRERAASTAAAVIADGAKHGSSDVVVMAQRYRGTNPTGRSHDWCAEFANLVLKRTGHRGSGSALARSFASYGRPAPGPVPGAIVVFPHHVGFVIGSDGHGRIRVVSGNHGHRVGEGFYATRRAIAYRYPA
ncbi:MAG: TIGR02594 family protein [Hyphomicrobiales bacterium]|nr:TIGR02594 family protein [Hyphomicrobiales bacterium]MBV8823831.1 TIGR02594 family protein [Hyphomicrobiales bacterium]MBV9429996.1 TIGR02594 family protein [Bradyrhizobiaceae bacterium]